MAQRRAQTAMAIVLSIAAVVLLALHAPVLAVIAAVFAVAQIVATFVAPRGRAVVTVLFVDVVGSTASISTEGDAAWDERFGRFRAAVHRELGRVPAAVIKDLGDGYLAAFSLLVAGPARVVDAVQRLQGVAAGLGLETRTGVHVGECTLSRRDVRGLAVHVASRLTTSAAPGQLLVSSTVRELIAGSDVRLRTLGQRELRGVTDPLHVYELPHEQP